jgi:RNA 3'-terminal phosphate cyclase (ATP)
MPSSSALIVIDGAHGEGGGALLRAALTMSALTQQPLKVMNVREGTRFPGLDPEDPTLIAALAESCQAEVAGGEIGSKTLSFIPTRRPMGIKRRIEAARNEAKRGPNALDVASSLLPVLARTGMYSSVTLEGETYGMNSLSYDYFSNVTLTALRRFGLYAYSDLVFAGFGRESRGEVFLDIEPSALQGVDWSDRGSLRSVNASVVYSGLSSTVADRVIGHMANLAKVANLQIKTEGRQVEAAEPGVFVTTWAVYERAIGGGASMGSKGVRAESLAQSAFEEMFDWMSRDATVDPFVADQILIPACLADGPTTFKVSRLTQRFLTTVWVVKQFTPIHITVRGAESGPGTISVRR